MERIGKNWKELKNGKFSRQYKNRENKLRKDKHGGKGERGEETRQ